MSSSKISAAKESASLAVKDNQLKHSIVEFQKNAAKFEDSLAGFAVMFAGLSPEYAKSIGVH